MAQTEFRKLWAASAASNLSDGITLVAAPLLAAQLGLVAPFWLGGLIGLLLLVSAWPIFSAATVASARRAAAGGD